jgi:hypothetical protein
MVIEEKELETCLLFIIKPYLNKYQISLIDYSLKINNCIYIKAKALYNHKEFNINVSFHMIYKDNMIIFNDIQGSIKYNILELSIMNILKQFIKIPNLIYTNNSIRYPIALPIQSIDIKDKIIIHFE